MIKQNILGLDHIYVITEFKAKANLLMTINLQMLY